MVNNNYNNNSSSSSSSSNNNDNNNINNNNRENICFVTDTKNTMVTGEDSFRNKATLGDEVEISQEIKNI